MTNDELKEIKEDYNYHHDRSHWEVEKLFDYIAALEAELEEEVELRESLEESLSEAQDEIVRLQDKLTTDFDEWEC
jgi:chromosome segregation ATPase